MPGHRFEDTVSALVYTFAAPHAGSGRADLQAPYNDLTSFVLGQYERLPDFLRPAMTMATLALGIGGFPASSPEKRRRRIDALKTGPFGPARDVIRYYESLATLALYSRTDPASVSPPEAELAPLDGVRCEIAVVGSGPGGSLTAALLAEAGKDVVLLEEGAFLPLDSAPPFSMAEMIQKYRHGGQTVAMGTPKIAYVEGRCVGGGSEINAGLYHRTPPEILDRWRREFRVEGLGDAELVPLFEANERDLSIGADTPPPPASRKLEQGAAALGWKAVEVPRWYRGGERRSMTRTFIPRFVAAGGRLVPRTRVERLRRRSGGWTVETSRGSIQADAVFACAGAVHTPALLLRSGIDGNVGRSLQMHPTAKITARFREEVNFAGMPIPVHQVKEFSPRLSFGGSISSQPYLALGLLEHPDHLTDVATHWQRMANYYAMITPEGRGTVRVLPGFRAPLVRYRLTGTDRRNLEEGLEKLGRILRAAGAEVQYPNRALMTIHLFSSCPMGEDRARTAVDSFGRVHGHPGLRINDASLLCTAPGVNPQGTIMALARRNVLRFLEER